jgi:hypothetical protein
MHTFCSNLPVLQKPHKLCNNHWTSSQQHSPVILVVQVLVAVVVQDGRLRLVLHKRLHTRSTQTGSKL